MSASLRLPKKLDLPENSTSKKYCHVGNLYQILMHACKYSTTKILTIVIYIFIHMIIIKMPLRLEFSGGQVACPRVGGCLRNSTFRRTPPTKSAVMLATPFNFSRACLQVLHVLNLGHSYNFLFF